MQINKKYFNVVDICILIVTISFIVMWSLKAKWDKEIKIQEMKLQRQLFETLGVENMSKEKIDAIMDIANSPEIDGGASATIREHLNKVVLLVPETIPLKSLQIIHRRYPNLNVISINRSYIDDMVRIHKDSASTVEKIDLYYKEVSSPDKIIKHDVKK